MAEGKLWTQRDRYGNDIYVVAVVFRRVIGALGDEQSGNFVVTGYFKERL